MKASDLFVKALENEGVEYIFGVPGEENLDLLESLRDSSIQMITTRHEQVAGFMAAVYGRLTGKPGVCLSTLGPGATNFVTSAAYAYLGAMPMLMITGQKPIKASKQGSFQIIDTVEIFRPVTKFTHQLVECQLIPVKVREAFRLAIEERPGPVHLELPEDIAGEHLEGARLFTPHRPRRPIAEGKAISRAVEMIQAAKRPLLLIGAGANRTQTAKMLGEFIDQTGIPFFNTQMGKGVIDEGHPLFLGTAALSHNDYLHSAVDHADLIINVGHDVIEKPPFFMDDESCEVIHINFYSAQVDQIYFPQLEVIGDIANAIWQIKEQLVNQDHWDFSYFMKVQAELHLRLEEFEDADQFPLLPQRIVKSVRDILPRDSVLTLDNGMYKIWFARHYPAYFQNSLILDNALATMGAGLPAAMAAKLVCPEKPVVTVCGDGGFMMNSQDVETAIRMGLHIVIIILTDSGYGMIKWKQKAEGFADFGLDFKNPDFVRYAEAYGAKGYRVESAEGFDETLKACLEAGEGVHLIDVPVDYSENQKRLIDELENKKVIPV